MKNILPNVKTSFNATVSTPHIGANFKISDEACVIGSVSIGDNVVVGDYSVLRGDGGQNIRVGDNTKIGRYVILHGFETEEYGQLVEKNIIEIGGDYYSVYIGRNVIMEDGVQVHGPAAVRANVHLAPDSFVFMATINEGCLVEHGAKVIGVIVPAHRVVPEGMVVKTQEDADNLPFTNGYNKPVLKPRRDYFVGRKMNGNRQISIGEESFVDKRAVVVGSVKLDDEVYVAPYSYIYGKNETMVIGSKSNIQDGVIVTYSDNNVKTVVGSKVSLAHQSKLYGCKIGNESFIGMQSELYDAVVGEKCVIEPGCVIKGVKIPAGRYVSSGSVITTKEQAESLPAITDTYIFKDLNKSMVHVNEQLAKEYSRRIHD